MHAPTLLATCACLSGWLSTCAMAGSSSPPARGKLRPVKWPNVADGFASVNDMGQKGTTGGAGGKVGLPRLTGPPGCTPAYG